MRLAVVYPAAAGNIQGYSGYWVYADEDLKGFNAVRKLLEPRFSRLLSARDFQAMALELQDKLVEWVDDNLMAADPTAWLLTPLHKNPFRSNFNLHAVWAAIVAEALKNRRGDIVVVTRSYGLVRTLASVSRAAGIEFRCYGRIKFFIDRWQDRVRSFGGLLIQSTSLIFSAMLAKRILGCRYMARLQDVEALVDTYVHDGDLSKEGMFTDRHLPGLAPFYVTHGIVSAYYPIAHRISLVRRPEMYRRMRAGQTLFAPFELFVRYSDIVRSAFTCIVHAIRTRPLAKRTFAGVDLVPLVELHTFRCAMEGLLPIVLARAPARLSAAGIRPRWLLDWYENQPIDKANVIGFGKVPGCRVIATRIYIPSRNILSLYTTNAEVEQGVAPNENWVCGRALVKYAATYDMRGCYRVVPALRYSHLYQKQAVRVEKELLILLTHSREESVGILECVTPLLHRLVGRFEKIRVKPHPDTEISELVSRYPLVFSNSGVVLDRRPLFELFGHARIVISAGSSSALEAVCAGIPVIVVGRNAGFDINPLEDVDRSMWKMVYDENEMRHAIESWSPSHPLSLDERTAVGDRIRSDYFEPVSEEAMEVFIPEPRHREHRVSVHSDVHSEDLHVSH